MSALYNKPIVGLIVIALVSIFLSSEFGIQLVESSAVRITVIMVVCLTIAAIYYIMLSPIQEMLARANSMSQGGDLGEAPSSGEDAGALYKSLRRMREEREKLEREIEAREERLGEFGEYLEQISKPLSASASAQPRNLAVCLAIARGAPLNLPPRAISSAY